MHKILCYPPFLGTAGKGSGSATALFQPQTQDHSNLLHCNHNPLLLLFVYHLAKQDPFSRHLSRHLAYSPPPLLPTICQHLKQNVIIGAMTYAKVYQPLQNLQRERRQTSIALLLGAKMQTATQILFFTESKQSQRNLQQTQLRKDGQPIH